MFEKMIDFIKYMTNHDDYELFDDIREEGEKAMFFDVDSENPYRMGTELHRYWNEGAGRI